MVNKIGLVKFIEFQLPIFVEFEDKKNLSFLLFIYKLVFAALQVSLFANIRFWAFMSFSWTLDGWKYFCPYNHRIELMLKIFSFLNLRFPKIFVKILIVNFSALLIFSLSFLIQYLYFSIISNLISCF